MIGTVIVSVKNGSMAVCRRLLDLGTIDYNVNDPEAQTPIV